MRGSPYRGKRDPILKFRKSLQQNGGPNLQLKFQHFSSIRKCLKVEETEIQGEINKNSQLDCRIYSSPAAAGLLCMVGAAIAVAIARYSRIARWFPYILVQKRSKSLDWIRNGNSLYFSPSLIYRRNSLAVRVVLVVHANAQFAIVRFCPKVIVALHFWLSTLFSCSFFSHTFPFSEFY